MQKLEIEAKPFLKWAGGKGQLIEKYKSYLPIELEEHRVKKYIEPFIGGGALFFHIAQKYDEIEELYINDINPDLILTYKAIKNDIDNLIIELKELENEYYQTDEENKQDLFYNIRSLFNSEAKEFDYDEQNDNWASRAAKLIFLNKTCFNGLFRVNSKGEYNVPSGKYRNPTICDESNLRAVSEILTKVNNENITCGDFASIKKVVDENTFVYFDPPYRPLNITSSFTSYTKSEFNDNDQIKLAALFKELHAKNAKLMLSNSDSKNEDGSNFFDNQELYGENYIKINSIMANRMINSNAKGRGAIRELLIVNY